MHHIDWNHDNNSLDNLVILCEWCHMEADKLGMLEFDRLLALVTADPEAKRQLRKSSEAWYQKLPSHRNVRNLTP